MQISDSLKISRQIIYAKKFDDILHKVFKIYFQLLERNFKHLVSFYDSFAKDKNNTIFMWKIFVSLYKIWKELEIEIQL